MTEQALSTAPPVPVRRLRLGALGGRLGDLQAWILVALVLVGVAVLHPSIATGTNAQTVLSGMAILGVLAVGQTIVLVGGGIDLSVAANVRIASLLGAQYMATDGASLLLGILLIVGIGMAVGLLNGVLIAVLRMPAFITTLGTLLLLDGATLTISSTPDGLAPEPLISFYTGKLAGIPYPALVLLAVAVVVGVALRATVWGRSVYAVGGDAELAEHAGLNVRRTRLSMYMLSGLLAGVAAVVLLSETGVGDPSAVQGFELQAITAAVIGGVSLAGGRGRVVGAVGGVAFLTLVTTVLSLVGVETRYRVLAEGLLILVALSSYRPRAKGAGAL
jgi:ribose transport system permease protein